MELRAGGGIAPEGGWQEGLPEEGTGNRKLRAEKSLRCFFVKAGSPDGEKLLDPGLQDLKRFLPWTAKLELPYLATGCDGVLLNFLSQLV
jgi:hypothetical protein